VAAFGLEVVMLIALGSGCTSELGPSACLEDAECPEGFFCDRERSVCRLAQDLTLDAARVDAALADRSVVDSGPMDLRASALDQLDASVLDQARADTSSTDLRSTDIRLPDSLLPDSLLPDNLLPDSAVPDAASCADLSCPPDSHCVQDPGGMRCVCDLTECADGSCRPAGSCCATSVSYGDVELMVSDDTAQQSGNFADAWDLTMCPLFISFTYDGYGLEDLYGYSYTTTVGAHAWTELGVRASGGSNFNPSNVGIWLAADYDPTASTFLPDPGLDYDDKLILQRVGGHGEADYDLPATAGKQGYHRIWFDRDGVLPLQAQYPVAVDGANSGTAHMYVNGLEQGFETNNDVTTMDVHPMGMTWGGDMTQQQLFYSLTRGGSIVTTHQTRLLDIVASGCLRGCEGS
jgi:hypothetical protein